MTDELKDLKKKAKDGAKDLIAEATAFSKRASKSVEQFMDANKDRFLYLDSVLTSLNTNTDLNEDDVAKILNCGQSQTLVESGFKDELSPDIVALRIAWEANVTFHANRIELPNKFIFFGQSTMRH